jgi:hypothetical protein
LSKDQVDIVIEGANGASYATICRSHKLSNDESLVRSFIRTTFRFYWTRIYLGGAMNYLSDLELHKFKDSAAE